jgi:hypothetical protein
MSRFAKHIRVGSHVQQGDVIGYVGMTGLATGPHLHYEYLANGVHKNPQTVQLAGAEPLRADVLRKFRSEVAPLLAALPPETFAGGPLAEPPASSLFSRSALLDDTRNDLGSYFGANRSPFAIN